MPLATINDDPRHLAPGSYITIDYSEYNAEPPNGHNDIYNLHLISVQRRIGARTIYLDREGGSEITIDYSEYNAEPPNGHNDIDNLYLISVQRRIGARTTYLDREGGSEITNDYSKYNAKPPNGHNAIDHINAKPPNGHSGRRRADLIDFYGRQRACLFIYIDHCDGRRLGTQKIESP